MMDWTIEEIDKNVLKYAPIGLGADHVDLVGLAIADIQNMHPITFETSPVTISKSCSVHASNSVTSNAEHDTFRTTKDPRNGWNKRTGCGS